MSAKTKAQLIAEIEALQERLAGPGAEEVESHPKNGASKEQAHVLGERVKELDCLYGISRLVETPGISLMDILQGSVNLLPPAWQYPQITCACIILNDQEYKTGNFRETKWKLASEIKVEGKSAGAVEVFYLEGQPIEYEGPFSKEERALIDAVAERLGRIIQRVGSQEKVEHLKLVLRAIRDVNQLIIREKNRDVLIQEICDNLTETRGYSTAWVMLLDERGEYLDSAESGLGKNFTHLLKEMQLGDFPACVQQALSQPSPADITDPSATCADCPITEKYSDKGRMTIRLEHAGKVYGVLSVSFVVDITVDEEELSLFEEVAGDIAFALYSIKTEQKRKQAQERAQKYLDIAEVIIVALNKEGEVTLINRKGSRILGYGEDELLGLNWFDTCLPLQTRKNIKESFYELMAEGAGLGDHFKQTVLTKSGEERVIDWHSTPLWEWVDEEKHRIGSLSSGEDITERKRAEQMLNALNKAAIVMGKAQTQQEIFSAVSEELKQLDISCMLFLIDETQSRLITKYVNFESTALTMIEKLLGGKHKDFSFPVDAVDMSRKVVREKKTQFVEKPEQVVEQVLPKLPKKILAQLIKTLRISKYISAPLIAEDQPIGMFSIQSDKLTREDIPAATAFAHQLAGAWNKTKLVQDLRKIVEGTIHTIAATVEVRDPYTAGHQTRVADLSAAIASEMHLSDEQVEGIKMAGIIHDLGKVQVPAEILSKPGKISEFEYEIIKTHSQVGFDLLKNIDFPWPIAEMVHQHHEMIDGSGYPQGLKGDEILLEARILAVADMVEAMSSHRPYRPALGIEKALKQIKQDKGTLFDPDVVDACLKIFKEGYKLVDN